MARGRDRLNKRRNGILAFRYRDASGEWKEKYCGTKNRKEARDFRDDFLRDLRQGTLPTEMADWRLDEAARWWNEYRKPRTAEGTQNSEPYRMRHFQRILGNMRLKEITNTVLDNYVTARLAGYSWQNADGKEVKQALAGAWSINKEVLLWSLILRKAKLWRRLEDDYRPLKVKASDIGRALTREELRHLAEVASTNQEWEAAFYGSVLAANTGLRGGEIKKLRVLSLDLEHRRLRILRASAKTDASARVVELNSDATEAAARLLMRYQSISEAENRNIERSLPAPVSRLTRSPRTREGTLGYDPGRSQTTWDTAWSSSTEEAGFPGLRFHDLRHTFITHMVERAIPLGVIQAICRPHLCADVAALHTRIYRRNAESGRNA